jgi:type IX secretion system PorP/SprF family membrane protein
MRQKITLFLVFLVQCLQAQQAPQYSMYMLNPYAYNPAYAGLGNSLIATGVYRQQWSGLLGAPATQHVNAHMPLYFLHSGVGLRVENDQIGAHQTTSAVLSYSYHLELGRTTLISIGVSGGYLQYGLDGNKLRAPEGTYNEPSGVFDHNDPFLPEGKVRTGAAVAEAGVYLRSKRLEISASLTPAYAPVLQTAAGNEQFRLKQALHYTGMVAYTLPVRKTWRSYPLCLLKVT